MLNDKDGNEERSLGDGYTPQGAKSGKKKRGKMKKGIKRQKTHEFKKVQEDGSFSQILEEKHVASKRRKGKRQNVSPRIGKPD